MRHLLLRAAQGILVAVIGFVVPAGADPRCDVPADAVVGTAPLFGLDAILKTRATISVLAIGSSSTEGVGASGRQFSYPSVLERVLSERVKGLSVSVANRGVGGEVAATTAERLRREVASAKPDLVLWQVGTNDGLAGVDLVAFEATLTDTVRWLRSERVDVVLVGLQYTPTLATHGHYQKVREIIRKVAIAENVLHVRRYEAMRHIALERDASNLLAADAFHLNDLGYRCMAEHVALALTTSLFHRSALAVGSAMRPVSATATARR